ncbi:prepilin peptidase [Pseudonocardia xinjiangensis]|uniref:Prepilin peptidase n=1 Tax=Pseudonocardia xinjiangensis TaxID=75289 RepID=A0ABX1RKH2_9PSEU|nr:prepilin peptidase [Pseudonocardia xinjiangensis]NMH80497.1 prepilin peptidase [Pseudonocardia xinjiangensis]
MDDRERRSSATAGPMAGVVAALLVAGLLAAGLLVAAASVAGAAAVLGAGVAGCAAGTVARVLLGRLRRGARIRPPWCELTVGTLWGGTAAGWAAGVLPAAWLPVLLGLGWFGVAAGAVDVVHRRLPDALTLPALPAALLLLLPVGGPAVLHAAAGAAVAAGAHAAVHLLARGAMGAGDVKLAAPLGAVLAATGWPALALAAVLAAVLTAALGVGALAAGTPRRGGAVPHGPSMLASTWLVASWLAAAGAVPTHQGGG